MARGKVGHFASEEARLEFLRRYDEMLRHWPVPFEELDIESGFGTTHVRRSGNPAGSPLILVHPNLGTSLAWWRLVEPLARDHLVFAVDTIGALGRSVQTKPITGSSDFADWLREVIDGLGADDPHLVGFSEGGWVVMSAALGSVPIRSLVAIEPGGAIGRVSSRFLAAMLVAGVRAQFDDSALQRFAERLSPGVEFAPGEMETMLYGGRKFRPALPFPKRFSDEDLARIDTPTLLYMGADTELYDPHQAAARAEALMPDVETVIVPNARHGLPYQYPELTTGAILEFIERVESR